LKTPLLVGSAALMGLRVVDGHIQEEEHYNSAYLVQGQAPFQRYDKIFLTPFGETMPYISQWPWLEEKLLSLGARGMTFDLDAGRSVRRLRLGWSEDETGAESSAVLVTPICFEDTVGWLCRRMVYDGGAKRADAFVNLSNDGWFGRYDGGREQHAQIARFRCIENRVPMVRSVNTGMSVAIDSCGRISGSIGEGEYGTPRAAGALPARLTFDSRTSLYGRIGESWAILTLLIAAAMLGRTFMGKARS
jgi:apolipoprotein N-acyltransferase